MIRGIFPLFLYFVGSFGFCGIFLDFGFWRNVFWNMNDDILGGKKTEENWIEGYFPDFCTLGVFCILGDLFWILESLFECWIFWIFFGIRIVTFWAVRKLKKIDQRDIFHFFFYYFVGSFLDSGFLESFLESEWSHFGGLKAEDN